MEEKNTKITDFIKYIEINQLVSARLLVALKFIEGKIYEQFDNIDYIEDIQDCTLSVMRNVGTKSVAEFKNLRVNYQQFIESKKTETIKETKTKLTDFIEYFNKHNRLSKKLLKILRVNILNNSNQNEYFLENISDSSFLGIDGIGAEILSEFKELKADYLQYVNPKESECGDKNENKNPSYYKGPREEFYCRLRSDISKTLKTIENKVDYVEMALLEKFERDGIELVKLITPVRHNIHL